MTERCRIAFFGSSVLSAYWNGAATYYRGLIRALHSRGHRVTFYEPDAFDRQAHRDLDPAPPWVNSVVYGCETADPVRRCLEDASHADLIIKASGVGVFDELLEAEVVQLKRPNNMVVFWDVDAPATIDRLANDPDDPLLRHLPQYDMVLTYGGGRPAINAYRRLGARDCVPIYNALDSQTHHPALPDARFASHLGLLANRMPDREARIDQFFFDAAKLMPTRRLLLGGSGWDDKRMPRNVSYLGHVYTRDHNAFNCTPLAVLNVSRDSMARFGHSPATRVFEAAGAGACLITDAWRGIEQFLEPDREVLIAHNGRDVAEHVSQLAPQRARRIGEAARRRVLAEHTYDHRAAQVEALLDLAAQRFGASSAQP